MERKDWQIFLLGFGGSVICAGIPTMLMEQHAYLCPGIIIVVIGITCLILAVFIKPNDFYYWNYVQRMAEIARKEGLKTNPNDFILKHFIQVVSTGVASYYMSPKSDEIKSTMKKIRLFHKRREKTKEKKVSEAYIKLWAYLTTFYEFRHESQYRNPNFNPRDLRRYEYFERTTFFNKTMNQVLKWFKAES